MAADETIYGSSNSDVLNGGSGDDEIHGIGGQNYIDAGPGNDTVYGGNGGDHIGGGQGDDYLYGNNGNNNISGDSGDDYIQGGRGDEALYGDSGNDTIYGGGGQDWIFGGSGDDYLDDGEPGGSRSVDRIYGGAGNDTLRSTGNQDSLYGGSGDDTFIVAHDGMGPFNNLYVYGGEGEKGGQNALKLNELEQANPGLQIIYEQGNPGSPNGRMLIKTASGQELGRITYKNISSVVICFAPGTLIATMRGEVPVEELQPGERVITRDNGMQELRWIGRRDLTPKELSLYPHLQPVMIRAGALGRGLPTRDLVVSPSHRMLVRSDRASLLYEESEVLIAAKHLVGMPGIERVTDAQVTYLHLLFDQHEVILANGAWSESFQPGDYSMKGLGSDQRSEIFYLFPELNKADALQHYGAARRSLKRHEVQVLKASGGFLG